MNDTQLRMYCFEQARAVLGVAPLQDLLDAAAELYGFLTGAPDPTTH